MKSGDLFIVNRPFTIRSYDERSNWGRKVEFNQYLKLNKNDKFMYIFYDGFNMIFLTDSCKLVCKSDYAINKTIIAKLITNLNSN